MRKKYILPTLGPIAAVITPIWAISCGSETAVATETVDLDSVLKSNNKKETIFNEIIGIFNGETKEVILSGEKYNLASFDTNQILQTKFQEFIYDLSQKYPSLIPSIPFGQKIFDPSKVINVTPLKELSETTFINNFETNGGGTRMFLGNDFPKTPAHSHFEFYSPALEPQLSDEIKNEIGDKIYGKWVLPWYADTGKYKGKYSIGQLSLPTSFGVQINLKIKVVPDPGYVLNDVFEKTLHMQTGPGPFNQSIKDEFATLFKNKIYSLGDPVTQNPGLLNPIENAIEDLINEYINNYEYTFADDVHLYNIGEILTTHVDQTDSDSKLLLYKVIEDLKNNRSPSFPYWTPAADIIASVKHDIGSKTDMTLDEFKTIINKYESAWARPGTPTPFEAIMATTELSPFAPDGVKPGGIITKDALSTGYASKDDLISAVEHASSLQELKDITDKFATKGSIAGLDNLASFDYNGKITSWNDSEGTTTPLQISSFADIQNIINGYTSINDFLPLSKYILGLEEIPSFITNKSVTLIPSATTTDPS